MTHCSYIVKVTICSSWYQILFVLENLKGKIRPDEYPFGNPVGLDLSNWIYNATTTPSATACKTKCEAHSLCKFWVWAVLEGDSNDLNADGKPKGSCWLRAPLYQDEWMFPKLPSNYSNAINSNISYKNTTNYRWGWKVQLKI